MPVPRRTPNERTKSLWPSPTDPLGGGSGSQRTEKPLHSQCASDRGGGETHISGTTERHEPTHPLRTDDAAAIRGIADCLEIERESKPQPIDPDAVRPRKSGQQISPPLTDCARSATESESEKKRQCPAIRRHRHCNSVRGGFRTKSLQLAIRWITTSKESGDALRNQTRSQGQRRNGNREPIAVRNSRSHSVWPILSALHSEGQCGVIREWAPYRRHCGQPPNESMPDICIGARHCAQCRYCDIGPSAKRRA